MNFGDSIWYNNYMSFIRPWAIWRRVQYLVGLFLSLGVVGVLIFFTNFYVPPNCFDRTANGDETGVDCGGGCVQICQADVVPPRVVWTESFEITKGQYNVVAYVENANKEAGAPVLNYTFQLFSNGEMVGEREGQTVLPPDSIYPIFEGRVFVDGAEPVTETKVILEQSELWLPSTVGRDQFRSTDINLISADSRPQLYVDIENTTLLPADNIEVVATVFNEKGDPVTASQTFIDNIEPRSTEGIVFTWPNPIAKTIKNCVIPTDVTVAIDLSGSMNNDGSNPPQPITKALEAAGTFIDNLRNNDQVSVVTFDSKANLVTGLTNQHNTIADTTRKLKIDPGEETGFTNTVDALKLAQAELGSDRHNENARRVLVLLTDGLPTISGNADVVKEAEELSKSLNESGIEIYSIGLGNNVDQQFIRNIASYTDNAYFAPTGTELSRIYTQITSSLCEVGPTKIDIIAKTKTNFAPLQ
ncbi:VWA domain-containing protein [Candidatus Nomurabacteria bacterium]|nr:VWA domain-containing protein [Candidatus Kaiserbacteria bacterium]MCB9815145.1 VWA domain-containing protein [Candidatus Nomurabacteria bacterium]